MSSSYNPNNRIFYNNTQVSVPKDISAGQCSIDTIVHSSQGGYTAKTNLKVDRLESIPFLGVPLSVLTLVFLGAITYLIIVFILTRNFEANYLRLGLASFGLGFLNWYIAGWFYSVGTIEAIKDNRVGLAILFRISILLGVSIGMVIKAFKMYFESRTKKEEERIGCKKGYRKTQELVLDMYIRTVLSNVRLTLGRGYHPTLKVYLKTPYDESKNFIVGIFSQIIEKKTTSRLSYCIKTNYPM